MGSRAESGKISVDQKTSVSEARVVEPDRHLFYSPFNMFYGFQKTGKAGRGNIC
jgi:hypothetical protein